MIDSRLSAVVVDMSATHDNESGPTFPVFPFPPHPLIPPSPAREFWERYKLPPQTYFDAFTALKTHVVATSFIRLYALLFDALSSDE